MVITRIAPVAIVLFISVFMFAAGGTALAAATPSTVPCPPGSPPGTLCYKYDLENPLKVNDFLELIASVSKWLVQIAVPIAVIMIVYAGIMFLTSRGDQGKITEARKILWYAVIGIAIIVIGRGFVTLIQSVLGVKNPNATQQPTPK